MNDSEGSIPSSGFLERRFSIINSMTTDLLQCNLEELRANNLNAISADNKKRKAAQINNSANILALVISCITRNIPEAANMSEKDFIKFQHELDKIINGKKSK